MTLSILVEIHVCVDKCIECVFPQVYIIKKFQPYSGVERIIQRAQYTHHLEPIIIILLCWLSHISIRLSLQQFIFFLLFFLRILFIYVFMRGGGRGRLYAGSLTWDSIPVLQDHALGRRRC